MPYPYLTSLTFSYSPLFFLSYSLLWFFLQYFFPLVISVSERYPLPWPGWFWLFQMPLPVLPVMSTIKTFSPIMEQYFCGYFILRFAYILFP